MPNIEQPQGVIKYVKNPSLNDKGKYVIDFEMPEDTGIATASHLALIIDDATTRASIDLVFNTALLRTRYDDVHIEVVSNIATNLNIYTLLEPAHLTDYTAAPKRTLAVVANKPEIITIRIEDGEFIFTGMSSSPSFSNVGWQAGTVGLTGDQPDNTHENLTLINIVGDNQVDPNHILRIDLDENNFDPLTHLCVVRVYQYSGVLQLGSAAHNGLIARVFSEKIVDKADYWSFVIAKYAEPEPLYWGVSLISVSKVN